MMYMELNLWLSAVALIHESGMHKLVAQIISTNICIPQNVDLKKEEFVVSAVVLIHKDTDLKV